MSILKEISQAAGAPATVRIGTVVAISPLGVSVQGTVFTDVGVVGTASAAIGDTVVLIGQSNSVGTDVASWLCIGSVTPSDPGLMAVATLRQTSVQSLANGTSVPINFDVADIDTVGGWDAALPSRYTSHVPGRAIFQCSGGVTFAANGTGIRTVQFRVNGGSDMAGTGVSHPANATLTQRIASRTSHILLNEGDYVEIAAFQNSGGALNTGVTGIEQSTLEVRYVGRV